MGPALVSSVCAGGSIKSFSYLHYGPVRLENHRPVMINAARAGAQPSISGPYANTPGEFAALSR